VTIDYDPVLTSNISNFNNRIGYTNEITLPIQTNKTVGMIGQV